MSWVEDNGGKTYQTWKPASGASQKQFGILDHHSHWTFMPDRQCRGEKTSEGTNHCTRRDKVNTRAFKSLIKQGDGLIDASQTNKHKYRQTNETIASPSSGGADSDSQSKSFLSD